GPPGVRTDSRGYRRQRMARSKHGARVARLSNVQDLQDEVVGVAVVVEVLALVALEGEELHRVVQHPVRYPRIARLEPAGRDRLPRVEELRRDGVVDLKDAVGGVRVAVQIPPALTHLARAEGDEPALAQDELLRGLAHVGERGRVRLEDLEHAVG